MGRHVLGCCYSYYLTHSAESIMCPPPHSWAQKSRQLSTVTVIDRGDGAFCQFDLLNGCGIVRIWTHNQWTIRQSLFCCTTQEAENEILWLTGSFTSCIVDRCQTRLDWWMAFDVKSVISLFTKLLISEKGEYHKKCVLKHWLIYSYLLTTLFLWVSCWIQCLSQENCAQGGNILISCRAHKQSFRGSI